MSPTDLIPPALYEAAVADAFDYLKTTGGFHTEPVLSVIVRVSPPMVGRMGEFKGKQIQKAYVFHLSFVQVDGETRTVSHLRASNSRTFFSAREARWYRVDQLNRWSLRSSRALAAPLPANVEGYLSDHRPVESVSGKVGEAVEFLKGLYAWLDRCDFSKLLGFKPGARYGAKA